MRDSLKASVRWSLGWLWAAVALLVLPNCSFNVSGLGPLPRNLDPGPTPHTSAIFCDIEKDAGRHCATAADKAMGVRLAAAAVALNTGQTSTIGLDESPAALARCGGEPEAVLFQGAFPEGYSVCLNCGAVLGPTYADANAVCVAQCEDVFDPAAITVPPPADVAAFCGLHAHASTNFPISSCFDGACTTGGMLRPDFADPRRLPEALIWVDLIGVSAASNNLTRTAATTTNFDAGAASPQWMSRGDAYVEFSASETDKSHVIGFGEVGCPFPCADVDPSLADIGFAVSLNRDGRFYVVEGGVLATGPDVNGSFGTYAVGQRFRVSAKDNSDGTASITYSRLTASCVPGTPCPETVFFTHVGGSAQYPLRVDASFREQGATLADVRVVRIQ